MASEKNAVRERPILFSSAMVRAILDGRKTQTRRVVKWTPGWLDDGQEPQICAGIGDYGRLGFGASFYIAGTGNRIMACPYGQPGDRLWVREAWTVKNWTDMECAQMGYANAPTHPTEEYMGVQTRAVFREGWQAEWEMPNHPTRWTPSIHMPRWASRLSLDITEVGAERLQSISKADAWAEGVLGDSELAREAYRELWDSLNASRGFGWDANPWVWAISFKVVESRPSLKEGSGE